jgi:nucleotide-binding universal stress UspA family protein
MDDGRFKILVGTDFSAGADLAFGEAVRLARRAQAEVHVVHVVPSSVDAPIELSAGGSRELDEIAGARARLEDYCSFGDTEKVTVIAHLRMGRVAGELLDAIRALAPDLVIVGTRGHGQLARALLGSVSDEVCRDSPCQVLIIPSTRALGFAVRPRRASRRFAWSCRRCGHILAAIEAVGRCAGCGLAPGAWWGASIDPGAADRDAPAVGHAAGDVEVEAPATERASSIAVGPAGTSGYDVNPELRIRY